MTKDDRLYGKFTLDFPDHPKIAILSDGAFRTLVEATLWSRSKSLDGRLPLRYAVARWSLEILDELCANDTMNPSLSRTETDYIIHDYADHQDTKAEIDARRERNRAAGQRGGLAKAKRPAKRSAKRTVSEVLSDSLSDSVSGSLSRGRAPAETPNGVSVRADAGAHAGATDASTGVAPATPALTEDLAEKSRIASEAAYQRAKAERGELLNARQLAIRNCALCDDEGYRPNHTTCDHVDRELTAKRGAKAVREEMGWK